VRRSRGRLWPCSGSHQTIKWPCSIVSSNSGSASITVTCKVGYDLDLAAQDVQNYAQNALAPLPSEVVQEGASVTKQSTDFTSSVNVISPDGRYDDAFLGTARQRMLLIS
jgi:multidrug efflux pump subunit AcrB